MKIDWKKLASKDNLLILALVGVLLFVISIPVPKEEKKEQNTVQQVTQEVKETDYKESMEQQLEEILSQINGVGKVKVMITLATSEEQIVLDGKYGEEPYVTKTRMPQVEGILVVAKGAGTGRINEVISTSVQALFPVDSTKIMVAGMRGD